MRCLGYYSAVKKKTHYFKADSSQLPGSQLLTGTGQISGAGPGQGIPHSQPQPLKYLRLGPTEAWNPAVGGG